MPEYRELKNKIHGSNPITKYLLQSNSNHFFFRSLRVTVGTNSWNQGGQSYRVSGNVTHPAWTPSSVKNDIGILHTPAAIVFNDLVKPIPVSYDFVGEGVSAVVAGWGRTSVRYF